MGVTFGFEVDKVDGQYLFDVVVKQNKWLQNNLLQGFKIFEVFADFLLC
jgi:hypothetical protein